jgi:hypothetical protein
LRRGLGRRPALRRGVPRAWHAGRIAARPCRERVPRRVGNLRRSGPSLGAQLRRRKRELLNDGSGNARGARSRAQERQCPRCNRWILYTALSQGLLETSFITLWNGEPGDGRGGTQNMVELVRASSPVGSRSSSTPRLCNCARATNYCAAHLRRHGSARRAFELEKAGSLTRYRPPTSWKERGVSEMAAAMQLAETPTHRGEDRGKGSRLMRGLNYCSTARPVRLRLSG